MMRKVEMELKTLLLHKLKLQRRLLLPLLISAVIIGPVFSASASDPTPQTIIELEILRKPVAPWSSFLYSDKSLRIQGGAVTGAIRLTASSFPSNSVGAKELSKYSETLVLHSENNSRCYIPSEVVQSLGFETVEAFRLYLMQSDVAKVECIVDIASSLNVAAAVVLYYDFVRRPPTEIERKLEKAPAPATKRPGEQKEKSKLSRDGRASP